MLSPLATLTEPAPLPDLPALETALRSPCARARLAAVEALRRLPRPEVVPPLCRALRDREPRVRFAAAEALAEVGDERAIGPLQEALRASLVGRSAWRHLAFGWLMCLATMLVIINASVIAHRLLDLKEYWLVGILTGLGQALIGRVLDWRGRGQGRRALIDALVRIGERHPTPELRQVIRDLRVIGSGWVQQDPSTRPVSEKAARRIRELTDNLKSLPLPASGTQHEATLPRVGEAPTPEADTLPRVR
ncbi:MAG: HEAT repeat domain-containing protein [Armatimonadota bacterium]